MTPEEIQSLADAIASKNKAWELQEYAQAIRTELVNSVFPVTFIFNAPRKMYVRVIVDALGNKTVTEVPNPNT